MTLGRVLCDRAFFAMGRALDVWNEKAPSKWPHKMSKTALLFFASLLPRPSWSSEESRRRTSKLYPLVKILDNLWELA